MRRKSFYENSYACLLAEILEEDAEESTIVEDASPSSSKVGRRKRRQLRQRASNAEDQKPTASSASSPPSPSASPAPKHHHRDRGFELLEVDDERLPEVLKFNRFIQTGYRPAPMTRSECLCSVLPLLSLSRRRGERPPLVHNETFNVATHLVPLVLILLALSTGSLSGRWPGEGGDLAMLLHSIPVVLCLAGSVCYHALMADVDNYARYLSVDVCGILALAVDCTRAMSARPVSCSVAFGGGGEGAGGGPMSSALELLRAALAALPFSPSPLSPSASPRASGRLSLLFSFSRAALARDAALAGYSALVAFAALRALRGKTAAQRGVPLLALLSVRLGVLAARAAEVRRLVGVVGPGVELPPSPGASHAASLRLSLKWYASAELASFVGGLINVLRVPERFVAPLAPTGLVAGEREDGGGGREGTQPRQRQHLRRWRLVDFAFNSHNLMHLFSLVALGCYHCAATEDRRHWVEHGCGVGVGD